METIAPVSFQISKDGFIEQTESQAKTTIPPGQGLRFTFQISLKNKLTRVENSLQLFFFRGSQQLVIRIGNPQLHNCALGTALDALLVFAKEFFTEFDSLYLSKRSHSLGTRLKWLSVPIHCHRFDLTCAQQYSTLIGQPPLLGPSGFSQSESCTGYFAEPLQTETEPFASLVHFTGAFISCLFHGGNLMPSNSPLHQLLWSSVGATLHFPLMMGPMEEEEE